MLLIAAIVYIARDELLDILREHPDTVLAICGGLIGFCFGKATQPSRYEINEELACDIIRDGNSPKVNAAISQVFSSRIQETNPLEHLAIFGRNLETGPAGASDWRSWR